MLSRQTHAESFGASFHTSSYHKPIAGLKDMERAGDCGEGHGTHEDGHVPGQTAEQGEMLTEMCEKDKGGLVTKQHLILVLSS